MKISAKQNHIAETIRGHTANQIFLIGALGTSKTLGAAVAMLSVAINYPGSLLVVGRRHLTEMKRGTLLSFHEAAGLMNFRQFAENRQEMLWTLYNGSLLMFIELDHTKDRQFQKVKSINATCAMIDEADGVTEDAHIALFSRTGRRNRNGAPRFILDTCNPNEAWVKERVYDPWQGGTLPDGIAVIEFELADSFLGPDYYAPFVNMPLTWRKRYLYNDWNYGDDDASLFKYRHMDRQTVDTFSPALRYVGNDIARTGRDRSVIAMMEGACLVDIKITKDRDDQLDTAEQGDILDAYLTQNLVGYENAGVDAVGIGVGVVDHMKKVLQKPVHEFMAGAASTDTMAVKDKDGKRVEVATYANLRSQLAHGLSMDLERGDVFLYAGCPFLSEFKKEATMHNYDIKERVLALEPKDKVKERLGYSPDIFDAVLMAYERWRSATRGGAALPKAGAGYDTLYNNRMSI